MASYAGAVQAIKDRFAANWTATAIAYQNEDFEPTADTDGRPEPWVMLEVMGNDSSIVGSGTPGNQSWLYLGHILIHVFVAKGEGDEDAQTLAAEAGEVFRAAGFYNDGLGSIVRCWSPRTDGGGDADYMGNWWRVTCTIPFEFHYRG